MSLLSSSSTSVPHAPRSSTAPTVSLSTENNPAPSLISASCTSHLASTSAAFSAMEDEEHRILRVSVTAAEDIFLDRTKEVLLVSQGDSVNVKLKRSTRMKRVCQVCTVAIDYTPLFSFSSISLSLSQGRLILPSSSVTDTVKDYYEA